MKLTYDSLVFTYVLLAFTNGMERSAKSTKGRTPRLLLTVNAKNTNFKRKEPITLHNYH